MKRFLTLVTVMLLSAMAGLWSGITHAKSSHDYDEVVVAPTLNIPDGWEVGAIECSFPNQIGTACTSASMFNGTTAMRWQDWLKAQVGPTARIVSLYRDSRDNVMITYIYQP